MSSPNEHLPLGARRVERAFFADDSVVVAPRLLGKILCREGVAVRITEVEAYREDDTACHARAGRTERNAPIWGPPGRVYVYLCYGLHQMLNVVTDRDGVASAVLIRACEPVAGIEVISARRGGRRGTTLLDGPGKVGAALGLDRSWCGHPLHEPGGLELRHGPPPGEIRRGPRIGIEYAEPEDVARPWRFADAGSAWVSHRKLLGPPHPPPA